LVSRFGDGDVPGPEESDCKGHVPLLAAESEKEISYLGAEQIRLRSGVRGQFRLHLFTGFSWIYFNSRQLLHKEKTNKSIIIQHVEGISGMTISTSQSLPDRDRNQKTDCEAGSAD
jgi:hypothetical protein